MGASLLCLAFGCAGNARTEAAPGVAGSSGTGTGGSGGAVELAGDANAATGAGAPDASGTAGQAGSDGSLADPKAAGRRPLRLLTRREYLATVRDLLGFSLAVPELPADQQDFDSGFAFHTTGSVVPGSALQYRRRRSHRVGGARADGQLAALRQREFDC